VSDRTEQVSKTTENVQRRSTGRRFVAFVMRYYIQWLLVVALIVLGIVNPNFRRLANLENILLQSSFTGIGAAGMTLLIIAGAFDLSVAGLLGFAAVVLALLIPFVGIPLAVLVSFLVGAFLGLLNGGIVTRMRIPAFIATLGMMNVYLGLAFIVTRGQVISVTSVGFQFLGTGAVLGFLPVPFIVMIFVYLICYFLLQKTPYGRYVRAIGSSERAAFTGGIPVRLIRTVTFLVVGSCTAIAGVLLTAELSSANAIMASGYELNAIAIVVVGGTSLKGGSGTLFGSFTGAVFFTVISNALNMFGVGAYWQYVAAGLLLIVALGIQVVRGRTLASE